jgi:RNA polymerase sigma factor for flagellar operon FliA
VEELHKLLNEVNVSSLISLEDFLEQNYEIGMEPTSGRKQDRPEYEAELNELSEILGNAIDKLPEKEKMVLTLYYYEELTLKEISAIMKVSESRISQLHTKAIMRLRGKLARQRTLLED